MGLSHEISAVALRNKLGTAYGRIEELHASGKLSLESGLRSFLKDTADDPNAVACRDAALQIAKYVDAGQDGSSANAYHNPMHFAKVAYNFVELAKAHNKSCPAGARLDSTDITMGVLAAIAHDLGHNGKGNTVDGVHIPFHLESQSINGALELIDDGLKQNPAVKKALSLVYGTDVSGSHSPAHVVREHHDFHFGNAPEPNVRDAPTELLSITSDPKMVMMASLLQDADVIHSVLDSTQNAKESVLVAEESKMTMTPGGSQFFLKNLLGGRMTTDVARGVADGFITKQMAKNEKELAAAAKAAEAKQKEQKAPTRQRPAVLGMS